jgi:GNAT superfamily N-acetyltransferase
MAPPRKRKFKIIDLTSQAETTMEVVLHARRDGAVLVEYGKTVEPYSNPSGWGRDWLYGFLARHPVLIASEEARALTYAGNGSSTKLAAEWPDRLLKLLDGEEPTAVDAEADARIYLATRFNGYATAVLSRDRESVYWQREFLMKGSEAEKLVEFVNTYRSFYVNGGSQRERAQKESQKLGRAVGVKTVELFIAPNQYTMRGDGSDWNAYVFPDSGTDTIEFRRPNAVEGSEGIRVNARTLMERYSWSGYQQRPDIRRDREKWLLVNEDPRPRGWWMTSDVAYNLVYDIYKVQQQGWQTREGTTVLDMSKVANFPFTTKLQYSDGDTFEVVAEYGGRTKDWGARVKLTSKEQYGHGLEAKGKTARKLVQRWWFSSVPNRIFVEDVPKMSERWLDLFENADTHWVIPTETTLQLTAALDARYERGLKGVEGAGLSGIVKHGASDFLVVLAPEGEERITATRNGVPVEVVALSIERNVNSTYGTMATIALKNPEAEDHSIVHHGFIHTQTLRSVLQTGKLLIDATPHVYEVTLNQRMLDQLAVEIDRLEEKGLPVSGLDGARMGHNFVYGHHDNVFGEAVLHIDHAEVVPMHASAQSERVVDIAVINVGENNNPMYAMEAMLQRPSGIVLTYLGHTNFIELKQLADTGQLVRNVGYASLVRIDATTQRELAVVLDQLAEKGLHGLAALDLDEETYSELGLRSLSPEDIEKAIAEMKEWRKERGLNTRNKQPRQKRKYAAWYGQLEKLTDEQLDKVRDYYRSYAQRPEVKAKRDAYYAEYMKSDWSKILQKHRAKRYRERQRGDAPAPSAQWAEYPKGTTEAEKQRLRRLARKNRGLGEVEERGKVWVTPMKRSRALVNEFTATAFRGEKYLGNITVRITKTVAGDDVVQVTGIVTKDEAERRQGVGTKLYEAAADWARDQGLRLISDFARTEQSEGFWRKQVEKGRAEPVIVDERKSRPYYYKLKRGQTNLGKVK